MDLTPLVAALVIACLGVVNLSSAAQATAPELYLQQALWVGLGAGVTLVVGFWDYRNLEQLAYPLYAVVLVLLVVVLVKGRTIMGAKRWIALGPMNMQPSEAMKLALILTMARYLARWDMPGGYTLRELFRPLNLSRPLGALGYLLFKWKMLGASALVRVTEGTDGSGRPRTAWRYVSEKDLLAWDKKLGLASGTWSPDKLGEIVLDGSGLVTGLLVVVLVYLAAAVVKVAMVGFPPRSVVAPMDLIMLPASLILIQPDLGTSSINVAVALSMVLFCGVRRTSLAIGVVLSVAGAVAAWFTVLKGYQKKRVLTFLDPEADALGAGYHANQSMIAIGSGGTEGKGFKAGTQTQLSFLPENHTDFVFSVLGEEGGLMGGTVLLALFFVLLWAGVNVASRARDRFGALLCVGVVAFLFWHVFVNVAMVTGALPVVGVTLPLMSYGGSSVMVVMGGIGTWLSVSNRRRLT
jgi:rod shape determining protein RodA